MLLVLSSIIVPVPFKTVICKVSAVWRRRLSLNLCKDPLSTEWLMGKEAIVQYLEGPMNPTEVYQNSWYPGWNPNAGLNEYHDGTLTITPWLTFWVRKETLAHKREKLSQTV
jgi:hypothetical protein